MTVGPPRGQSAVGSFRVPRYQYLADLALSFLFLCLFSLAVGSRRASVHVAEMALIAWAGAYLLDQLRKARLGGRRSYFSSLFAWIDFAFSAMLGAAFGLRLAGLLRGDAALSSVAFDLLACTAPLLRLLNGLAGVPWVGVLLVCVQQMLAEAAWFLAVLSLVLAGFSHALLALQTSEPPADLPSIASARPPPPFALHAALAKAVRGGADGAGRFTLLRSAVGSREYDTVADLHPSLGPVLLTVYLVLVVIVLLATGEFLLSCAVRTLRYSTQEPDMRLLPPFNLAPLALAPLLPLLPARARGPVALGLPTLLLAPALLLIAGSEWARERFAPPRLAIPPPEPPTHGPPHRRRARPARRRAEAPVAGRLDRLEGGLALLLARLPPPPEAPPAHGIPAPGPALRASAASGPGAASGAGREE
eukprot:tig00020920_g15909.t1